MKHLFLLLLCCSTLFAAQAGPGKALIRVQLSSGQLLTLSIDDRRYNRYGPSLSIGNLPSGRHELRVYRYFHPGDKGNGDRGRNKAQARLVYQGRIKVKAGRRYDCIVDARRGNIEIRESAWNGLPAAGSQTPDESLGYSDEAPAQSGQYTEDPVPDASGLSTSAMNSLKDKVSSYVADGEKLKAIKAALDGQTYSAAQVAAMCSWLMFDDSRLDLAKWAYPHTTDKAAYGQVADLMSFESSKKTILGLMGR